MLGASKVMLAQPRARCLHVLVVDSGKHSPCHQEQVWKEGQWCLLNVVDVTAAPPGVSTPPTSRERWCLFIRLLALAVKPFLSLTSPL